jgi:NAD(P)-dependent dehydrogenase (short-subunit alcohol dehydrogenase family)
VQAVVLAKRPLWPWLLKESSYFYFAVTLLRGQLLADIAKQAPNCKATLLIANLASLADVRRAAQDFLNTGKPLQLLINNAGVMNAERQYSVDGIDEIFAVKHLAPMLLPSVCGQ